MNTKANVSRNLGANIATGDYILFLDDDVTIAPDFIEKTIKFVRSRADGAISRLRIGQKDIGIIFNENGLLIRREIISKYPFDETLGPGTLYASSEALDLKIRLARAGIRLVESEALVLHPPLIESVTAEKVFLYAVGNSIVALRYGQVSNLLLEMCKCIAKGFLNIFGLKKRHSFVRQRLAGLIAGTILYEKNTLDR
jgi:glycosyltransferase involved in cell wall biosynthesis